MENFASSLAKFKLINFDIGNEKTNLLCLGISSRRKANKKSKQLIVFNHILAIQDISRPQQLNSVLYSMKSDIKNTIIDLMHNDVILWS